MLRTKGLTSTAKDVDPLRVSPYTRKVVNSCKQTAIIHLYEVVHDKMPSKASAKKPGWIVVAARIPKELKDKLKHKHPDNGAMSELIYVLLDKYEQGRILGVKLSQ